MRGGLQMSFLPLDAVWTDESIPQRRYFQENHMARTDITTCALLGLALAIVSCVPPKAAVVAPPAVVKNAGKKDGPEPVVAEPPVPNLPDEGTRMPNFLDLPSDADFRSTNSSAPKPEPGSGTVTSRPPTDPPSRVKPKPAGQE